MVYNPATDFLALWRNSGGQASKVEMPGLDYVVAAMSRAGLITLAVSAIAPVVSQSTTAWLQAATPSNSAEGVMRLWDSVAATYVAATPALLFKMLQTAAAQNGVSWWTSVGGPPANIVGNNGDFAIRTDAPNGFYGPKALGVWPATPIPGTADVITSVSLDNTFGATQGQLIYRGPAAWQALPVGTVSQVLTNNGTIPNWGGVSALLDTLFGSLQGSIFYRGAGTWSALSPGVAAQILQTNGPAADPSWVARTAEFPSGTRMVFNQTAAPTGWTKSVAVNDAGLRVVSGTVGSVSGAAFSTVFAQTVVGSTTLTVGQIPSHVHTELPPGGPQSVQGGGTFPSANIGTGFGTTGAAGGGGSHAHSINLALAYVDVIIASKD